MREFLVECHDDVGQDCASAREGNANAQDALVVLGDVPKLLTHRGVLLAHLRCIRQEHFARIGELEWHMTHDELASEFLLELGDMRAQRLLRDMQVLCCSRETPFAGKHLEVFH